MSEEQKVIFSRNYVHQRKQCAYLYSVREEIIENSEEFVDKMNRGESDNRETGQYLNLFYCVKFQNRKKINSHLWFLNGFCQEFNPDYCIFMDCGVKPEPDAIFKFFNAFEID